MKTAWLLVLLLPLAGCFGGEPDGPIIGCGQTLPDIASDATLDGEAAMQWVEAIVYLDNGDLRPRTPEDPDHACTADWLEAALDVPGWQVGRSDFTGAEYEALPKGSAAPWAASCGAEDRDAVASMEFHNLYATYGQGPVVLLAAHWDAKEDANTGGTVPAANDGASGMGVLLELQRVIAENDLHFPFTLAIAFFDGEDGFEDCHPLAGSLHFAQTRTLDVERMILLDMVGDLDARFPRESNSLGSDEDLVDLIWDLAPAHGLGANFVEQEKEVVDDHLPFIEAGIRAVDIIDFARPAGEGRFGFPPYWHTIHDTPDQLSPVMLERIGDLVLAVLQDPRFEATL